MINLLFSIFNFFFFQNYLLQASCKQRSESISWSNVISAQGSGCKTALWWIIDQWSGCVLSSLFSNLYLFPPLFFVQIIIDENMVLFISPAIVKIIFQLHSLIQVFPSWALEIPFMEMENFKRKSLISYFFFSGWCWFVNKTSWNIEQKFEKWNFHSKWWGNYSTKTVFAQMKFEFQFFSLIQILKILQWQINALLSSKICTLLLKYF